MPTSLRNKLITAMLLAFSLSVLKAQEKLPLAEHLAKESGGFPNYRTGRDLKAEAPLGTGDLSVGFTIDEHAPTPPPGAVDNPYDNQRLGSLVSASDLIAICTVVGRTSALTADRSFLFTHYDLSLETVLLNRKPSHTQGGRLYLTAPGGDLTVSGHKIHAFVSNIPHLDTGKQYLLFLSYKPLSDSFLFVSPDILRVDGATLTALRQGITPPNAGLLGNEANYLDAIRANIEAQSRRVDQ